jgi:hypothetical protein
LKTDNAGEAARVRAAFAARLRELVNDRPEMTHGKLSKASGLPPGTIEAYLRGLRVPSLTNLLALTRGLGLGSIEQLLGPLPSQTFPDQQAQ